MLQEKRIPPMKIRQSYLKLNVFSMICVKDISQTLNTSIFTLDIGSNQICLNHIFGPAQTMVLDKKRLLNKKQIETFLLGMNKNLDGAQGRIRAMKPLPTL